MDAAFRRKLAEEIVPLIEAAGRVVLAARAAHVAAARKADQSPVTPADLGSEEVLLAGLARLSPGIPALAEESVAGARLPAAADARCFLVDPLDGTREFLAGGDDFTVNVALVESGRPTLGVIHAPASGRLFLAWDAGEAFERQRAGMRKLQRGAHPARETPVVLVSRSHGDPASAALVARLAPCSLQPLGSALKFGLIAAGEADLYIRLAPTMAWDTAAGQAILEAAGGAVLGLDGSPLSYAAGRDLRNVGFVAARTRELGQRLVAMAGEAGAKSAAP